LQDKYVEAAVKQMMRLGDICVWHKVSAEMLKPCVVAQGAIVEVVHWKQSGLKEEKFLVPDEGVSNFLIDNWIASGDWGPMSGRMFASSIPAVAHMACNYCHVCGGVDMCRHILDEIVGDSEVDLSLWMPLAIYGVYDLLRLRENPSVVSLISAHIRYSIARSLRRSFSDVRLEMWERVAEDMVYDLYPHRIVAQTFLADSYTMLQGSFAVLYDIFMYLPRNACVEMSNLLKWIISSLKTFLVDGAIGVALAVMKNIFEKAGNFISNTLDDYKPLIMSLIKTIVRIAIGYSPMCVLLEVAWDAECIAKACLSFKAFFPGAFSAPGVVAEGVEDFGAVLATLAVAVFYACGRVVPDFKSMSDLMLGMVGAAAVFNRSQLWDQFKALRCWFDGEEKLARLEILRSSYPGSISMIECHAELILQASSGNAVIEMTTDLGGYYAIYLRELKSFGRDMVEMRALTAPAVHYITSNGIEPIESVRRRPAVFMFHGDSNIGKSRVVCRVADIIAFKHKDRYSTSGRFSRMDAIYNVCVGDEYASGYAGQDIWVFDEWLQEKDVEMKPSKSISLMFTLVSTAPNRLNMAAVNDKGRSAKVSLVLGATNIALDDAKLGHVVKSIHSPEALATRIKYRVKPILNPGYKVVSKRICREVNGIVEFFGDTCVPEEELYTFRITSYGDVVLKGDLANGNFSWGALLALVDKEYVLSKDFRPTNEVECGVVTDVFQYDAIGNVIGRSKSAEKEEDRAYIAEGFSDWFSFTKIWTPAKNKYFFVDGEEILVEVEECFKEAEGAYFAIRQCNDPCAEDIACVNKFDGSGPESESKRPLSIHGCPVYVKNVVKYTRKTLGLGLLMLAVGVVAAVPIAKKICQKVVEAKEVVDVAADAVRYKFRGDSSCVPEGTLVEVNGRQFFAVQTKNGYKMYAQGADDTLLSLLGNQRTVQQIPVIYDSIFNIVNNKILIGNAFAINDSRLLLPLHIARNVKRLGAELSNGKISVSLAGSVGVVQGFHIEELGDDVAVLCLDAFKLNGVKNNIKKLSRSTVAAGLCRQVFRDASGEIHESDGSFNEHDDDVDYATGGIEYKIARRNVRQTRLNGFGGMCGAVYININEVNRDNLVGGIVLGMHVAADESKGFRIFRVFDEVSFTLTSLLNSCYPALGGHKGGIGDALRFESDSVPVGGKVLSPGKLGKTRVPPCDGAADYDVAHLLPYVKDGAECNVLLNGIIRLREFGARDVLIPSKVEQVVSFLCKKLSKDAIICLPDWVGTYSGAGYLPSITRQTAAGYPLNQLQPSKAVMCMTDEELAACGLTDRPLPSVEAFEALNDLLDRIRSGQEYEAACVVSVKEEPRLASKVAEGNSRLFAGAPVHEFLLQRRFFMGVLATYLKRNIAVNSALGLDPSDFAKLHDYLLGDFKDPWILTADYSKMDQCFNPMFLSLVNRVIRSIALGRPVGDEVVSDDDYVRSVLLRRLAFNRLMIGNEVIEPKAGHPSGSCLTTVFNIVADQIIFTYAFWEMIGGNLEDIDSRMRCVFLGDDSIVCCDRGNQLDLNTLQKCANDCGFTLTGADKTAPLSWVRPYRGETSRSEYNFLGRFFTHTDGVLDIDRLSKMLQFSEERRFVEIIPQAILSHRQEVARYYATGQFDWCARVKPQLEFFGFQSVEEYISLSIPDLQQHVLSVLQKDPSKMKIEVPVYNRPKKKVVYIPQGPGDGEPSETVDLGDVEFVASMGGNSMANDCLQADYLKDHMDSENFAPEIFSRAISVTHGSTGTGSDVMLVQLTAASSFFAFNFNAQAKLANAIYMRCRFMCKVIVASGPFVTGKLVLGFRPGPTPPADVYQLTGDPCTELDLSSAKYAVVGYDTVIPGDWMLVEKFVNPASIASWSDGFDFGTISLWTITPVSQSVQYNIYVWLEDVELRGLGFTNFTLTPQGEKEKKYVNSAGKKEAVNDKTDKFHHVSRDYKGELEMMQWKWKVENTPGWLNTTAASVETTAGCVETVEESILGPVGNFLEKAGSAIGGGCAALFGACAPNPNPHFEVFMQAPNWAQAQMICPVPAVRLAVVQTQKSVIPRTLFGNRGDEMNIGEFTSRMGILARIPWAGLDSPGHTLASWNVMPGVTPIAAIVSGSWTVTPTPLAFVAGTFRMWRGGIKYRLSVAKTAFHTGTLEVVWQMGLAAAIPGTPSQDALSQRYIWDVTQSSSLEFEVPYVARTAFTQVYFTPFDTYIEASDLTTGRLFLNVVNPLANSAGTVPANIDIVLYVSGGSDIEFAMPGRHSQLTGYEPGPATLKRSWPILKSKARRYKAEGGPFSSDSTSDGLSTKVMERLRDVPYPSHWAHLTTTGERVLSLRVLLKRFSEGIPIPVSIDFNTALLNSWYLAYVSLAYTFWTGSWRCYFNITTNDFDTAPLPLSWQLVWNNTFAGPGIQNGEAHMTIAPWSNATVLEVPWYSPLAFRIFSDPGLCFLNGTSPLTSLCEFAAGDDMAYGFQIGPPQIVYSDTLPASLY